MGRGFRRKGSFLAGHVLGKQSLELEAVASAPGAESSQHRAQTASALEPRPFPGPPPAPHPADFGLSRLHHHLSQFLKINLSLYPHILLVLCLWRTLSNSRPNKV